jgi:replication factor A3
LSQETTRNFKKIEDLTPATPSCPFPARMSMDTSAPAPRINGELMARFVGKKVLLVGKAEGSNGGVVTLRTPDDRTVRVQLAPGSPPLGSAFVEFEGMVESPDALTETTHVDFGNEFDMYTYNELTKEANGRSAALFL